MLTVVCLRRFYPSWDRDLYAIPGVIWWFVLTCLVGAYLLLFLKLIQYLDDGVMAFEDYYHYQGRYKKLYRFFLKFGLKIGLFS